NRSRPRDDRYSRTGSWGRNLSGNLHIKRKARCAEMTASSIAVSGRERLREPFQEGWSLMSNP
ncbi:MAG: hypothetical protein ACRER2_01380, partial [Methylococcales bacterium]